MTQAVEPNPSGACVRRARPVRRCPYVHHPRPARPDEDGAGAGTASTVIDFAALPVLSSLATTQFAAQVVWTLANANVPGPYRLEPDGTPPYERHVDGWTTEDVLDFDHLLRSGGSVLRRTLASLLLTPHGYRTERADRVVA